MGSKSAYLYLMSMKRSLVFSPTLVLSCSSAKRSSPSETGSSLSGAMFTWSPRSEMAPIVLASETSLAGALLKKPPKGPQAERRSRSSEAAQIVFMNASLGQSGASVNSMSPEASPHRRRLSRGLRAAADHVLIPGSRERARDHEHSRVAWIAIVDAEELEMAGGVARDRDKRIDDELRVRIRRGVHRLADHDVHRRRRVRDPDLEAGAAAACEDRQGRPGIVRRPLADGRGRARGELVHAEVVRLEAAVRPGVSPIAVKFEFNIRGIPRRAAGLSADARVGDLHRTLPQLADNGGPGVDGHLAVPVCEGDVLVLLKAERCAAG